MTVLFRCFARGLRRKLDSSKPSSLITEMRQGAPLGKRGHGAQRSPAATLYASGRTESKLNETGLSAPRSAIRRWSPPVAKCLCS